MKIEKNKDSHPIRKWVEGLPKVELHCHLDGSLPEKTVRQLAEKAGISLPEEETALRKMLTVPADCKSLKEYLDCFSLPLSCLQTYDALYTASRALAEEAAKEGVVYLEVRFAPEFSAHDGFTQEDVVRSVRDGLKKAEQEFDISTGILLCGMRHFEPEKNHSIPKLASRFLGDGVCGIDLAGDEKAYPPELHREMFSLASEMGIPFTIHAGECGSAENVATSIQMGAHRIGHGIAMAGCPETRQLCREQKIAVEMCPTSNFQTKAVERREDYPLRQFLEEGLSVTVNTDNRTVSGTTLTEEILFIHDCFSVTRKEIETMMKNAAEAAFAPEEKKKRLWQKIDDFCQMNI